MNHTKYLGWFIVTRGWFYSRAVSRKKRNVLNTPAGDDCRLDR